MGEDLLRDFVHDEPPPDWEDLKKDLDEDTDIFVSWNKMYENHFVILMYYYFVEHGRRRTGRV
jgi:hypothetical protein